MKCLGLLLWEPPPYSLEMLPGPDLYLGPGKPLIKLRIGTRQTKQNPSEFLLWFPRRGEPTGRGVTDN